MEKKESLSDCVRKNLFRLRKSLKLNQEDLGNILGMKRSGYTRKETGTSPITLKDLDKLIEGVPNLVLPDLLIGYPGCDYSQPAIGLEEVTRRRFPFLEQVILTANLIAGAGDDKDGDIEFLQQCLSYASVNLEREQEKQGHLERDQRLGGERGGLQNTADAQEISPR